MTPEEIIKSELQSGVVAMRERRKIELAKSIEPLINTLSAAAENCTRAELDKATQALFNVQKQISILRENL